MMIVLKMDDHPHFVGILGLHRKTQSTTLFLSFPASSALSSGASICARINTFHPLHHRHRYHQHREIPKLMSAFGSFLASASCS